MHALQPERIHQADDISGHPVNRVRDTRMIALPNAAVIMHDYLEAFGENRDLIAPKRAITAETGDEEDRESNPMSLVIKLTIADRDARHGNAGPIQSRCRWLCRGVALLSNAARRGAAMRAAHRAALTMSCRVTAP